MTGKPAIRDYAVGIGDPAEAAIFEGDARRALAGLDAQLRERSL